MEAAADGICRAPYVGHFPARPMTIEIETVEQLLQAGYSVSTYCHACKRSGPKLDLAKYIDQGRGHLRPIDLGLKHQRCGRKLALTIHAAKGYGK